jgi:hypothetical protein
MRVARLLGTLAAVFTVTVGATTALGASISSIGALTPAGDGGIPASAVYAISPDGTYAVGYSNGQNLAGAVTISQAVIWSSASGLVQLPNAGDQATSARGVVVKANGDVGVAGYTLDGTFVPYRMGAYTASPSNLAGGTWVAHIQHNLTVGQYNAARMYNDGGGDNWTIAGQRANGGRAIQAWASGSTYADSGVLTGYGRVYNVVSRVPTGSSRGFAAGYEKNNTTLLKRALFGVTGSTQTVIPGMTGSSSEALGMSPDTTSTAGSGVVVGYDDGSAFFWTMGDAARTLLSALPGDTSSVATDVRLIGTNRMVVGSSTGTIEQAVVWDATNTPQLLSTILTGLGADLSDWTSLTRITTMSDNGFTVGGYGVWAADGTVRGFVAQIPEPATLLVLALGGLLLRRNRR